MWYGHCIPTVTSSLPLSEMCGLGMGVLSYWEYSYTGRQGQIRHLTLLHKLVQGSFPLRDRANSISETGPWLRRLD